MVQMKHDYRGKGVDVNKTSGFEPYDGPLPTPGVYAAVIRAMSVRISQNGNPYYNVCFELDNQSRADKQQYKGYPQWEKITPGDSDFQRERVGKLLHGICGKNPDKVIINVDHDEVTEGGKVNKVGGKDPIGARFKLVLAREAAQAGFEPRMRVSDLFGWTGDWPDAPAEEDDDVEIEDEEEPEVEDDEEEPDEEEEEDDEDGEEEEDDDEEDEDEFAARQEELNNMDRAALRSIAKSDYDIRVLKSHSDDDIRNAILDHEFPPEGSEDEDGDEPPF